MKESQTIINAEPGNGIKLQELPMQRNNRISGDEE